MAKGYSTSLGCNEPTRHNNKPTIVWHQAKTDFDVHIQIKPKKVQYYKRKTNKLGRKGTHEP